MPFLQLQQLEDLNQHQGMRRCQEREQELRRQPSKQRPPAGLVVQDRCHWTRVGGLGDHRAAP